MTIKKFYVSPLFHLVPSKGIGLGKQNSSKGYKSAISALVKLALWGLKSAFLQLGVTLPNLRSASYQPYQSSDHFSDCKSAFPSLQSAYPGVKSALRPKICEKKKDLLFNIIGHWPLLSRSPIYLSNLAVRINGASRTAEHLTLERLVSFLLLFSIYFFSLFFILFFHFTCNLSRKEVRSFSPKRRFRFFAVIKFFFLFSRLFWLMIKFPFSFFLFPPSFFFLSFSLFPLRRLSYFFPSGV